MPRINGIRFANITYNHGIVSIPDLTFDIDGLNTVFKLGNGGGKTVQILLLCGLFTKGRRRLQGYDYADYFTTRPSCVMVEWIPDGGDGKRRFITGLIARRNPNATDVGDGTSITGLDIITFIGEYDNATKCAYSLRNFPATSHSATGYEIPSWKTLGDFLKKQEGRGFHSYRLPDHDSEYFTELERHHIYTDEWAQIIVRLNQSESGLSTFFESCGTTEKLLDDWFLKAAVRHTDPDDTFANIQDAVAQYAVIRASLDETYRQVELYNKVVNNLDSLRSGAMTEYVDTRNSYARSLADAASLHTAMQGQLGIAKIRENAAAARQKELGEEIADLTRQQYSKDCWDAKTAHDAARDELERCEEAEVAAETRKTQAERAFHVMDAAQRAQEVTAAEDEVKSREADYAAARLGDDENHRTLAQYGPVLFAYHAVAEKAAAAEATAQDAARRAAESARKAARRQQDALTSQIHECERNISTTQSTIDRFTDETIPGFLRDHHRPEDTWNLALDITQSFPDGTLDGLAATFDEESRRADGRLEDIAAEITANAARKRDADDQANMLQSQRDSARKNVDDSQRTVTEIDNELQWRRDMVLGDTTLHVDDEYDVEGMTTAVEGVIRQAQDGARAARDAAREAESRRAELTGLRNGKAATADRRFTDALKRAGIEFIEGTNYLMTVMTDETRRDMLARRFPLLPYAVIIARSKVDALRKMEFDTTLTAPVIIMTRESLNAGGDSDTESDGALADFGATLVYSRYDLRLLHPANLDRQIAECERQIEESNQEAEELSRRAKRLDGIAAHLREHPQTRTDLDRATKHLQEAKTALENVENALADNKRTARQLENETDILYGKKADATKEIDRLAARRTTFDRLRDEYEKQQKALREHAELTRKRIALKAERERQRRIETEQDAAERAASEGLHVAQDKEKDSRTHREKFQPYAGDAPSTGQIPSTAAAEDMERAFDAASRTISGTERILEDNLRNAQRRLDKARDDYKRALDDYDLADSDVTGTQYNPETRDRLREESEDAGRDYQTARDAHQQAIANEKNADSVERKARNILRNRAHIDEPLPADQILDVDFTAYIKDRESQRDRQRDEERKWGERRQACDKNADMLSSATAEFDQIAFDESEGTTARHAADQSESGENTAWRFPTHAVGAASRRPLVSEWKGDLSALSNGDLGDLTARIMQSVRKARRTVDGAITTMRKAFNDIQPFIPQDDPILPALVRELRDEFDRESQTRSIRIASELAEKIMLLRNLTAKSENDIQGNQRDRANYLNDIERRLQQVNRQMTTIDKGSTIPVNGKREKMFELTIPDWDENRDAYHERLGVEFDHIVDAANKSDKGPEKALREMFTLQALYAKVVGLQKITLTLRKVERDRTVPMTWEQAKKNSGGEGTLSAFIVLASLLNFAGRSPSDVFQPDMWKVLPMDNPFGEMNAAHLLAPMDAMSQAKHVQLLCWTGIPDPNITRTFANNYVERLAPAGSGNQIVMAERLNKSDGSPTAESPVPSSRIDARYVQDLTNPGDLALF